ncbi:MAG: mechanosensitive ion channel family protein [Phycisphaerales bacterium]|nr:mechanosensitive ion channel family protein [Phycisphaerales bacterium]
MFERIETLVDVQTLLTGIVAFIPDLIAAFLILFAFLILYRVTRIPLSAAMRHSRMHDKLIELLINNIYRYTLVIFGIVMALDQLGVNVTAALAGIGVAGIALGFAAQDSVANVISGFLIFWDKPFEVSSWIRVEGQYGQVSDITLRTTRIRTAQNTFVVIPNKNIIDSVLENYTKHGEIRVDVPVGIAYKESIVAARQAILEAMPDISWVRSDPAPDVVVASLGDSSVDLLVRVWIDDPGERPKTISVVTEVAKTALDAAGIEIPYPHLQLFLENVEDRVWDRLAPVLPRSA